MGARLFLEGLTLETTTPSPGKAAMTRLLTKAFEEASKLPQTMQDQLGQQILEDLAGELQWNETLAASQDQLERLADEALEDLRAGRTREMGFDEL